MSPPALSVFIFLLFYFLNWIWTAWFLPYMHGLRMAKVKYIVYMVLLDKNDKIEVRMRDMIVKMIERIPYN